jgi:hypothetical protein
MQERILCWFSCGAASAVAAKKTIELFGETHVVEPVYCNTLALEHPDNKRFLAQCTIWLGRPIRVISSERYQTVDEVFETTRYMSGVGGARCTTELKKIPRLEYAQPDDIHIFGFTANEGKRIREFEQRNPELRLRWILRDLEITKADCYKILMGAGLRLPRMYLLGFDNNNCPGCVKASSPWYWDMIRTNFPEVFKRRCEQSRAIGCRLVEIKHHVRIFLDELPPGPFKRPRKRENLSCGPECGISTTPSL